MGPGPPHYVAATLRRGCSVSPVNGALKLHLTMSGNRTVTLSKGEYSFPLQKCHQLLHGARIYLSGLLHSCSKIFEFIEFLSLLIHLRVSLSY